MQDFPILFKALVFVELLIKHARLGLFTATDLGFLVETANYRSDGFEITSIRK